MIRSETPDPDPQPTPSPGPLPTPDPHVRLDYAFVPGAFAQQVRACEIVKTPDVARASDHFPLLIELGGP